MEAVVVNGKEIGHVWQEGQDDWAAEHSDTGSTWDMIDTREDAVDLLVSQ